MLANNERFKRVSKLVNHLSYTNYKLSRICGSAGYFLKYYIVPFTYILFHIEPKL